MLFRKTSSVILAVLVFLCASLCLYKGKQYATAAPSERTTTAHVVSVDHSIFRGLRFNYYSCSYNFSVNGSTYVGLRDCPQWIVDDAVKRNYLGAGLAPAGTNATVYFDPSDPSVNSLFEFSAASETSYQIATPWISLGAMIIIFSILGRLLAANEKRRNGEVVIDFRGSTIYPKEIGRASEAVKIPNSRATNRVPSSDGLREQYLEVVNKIHPDRATNEADLAMRERMMKAANAAFERGDAETLRRVLEEHRGAIPTARE